MKISEKYRHIGYSFPGVPKGWVAIVEEAIVKIEKEMWPKWIPMFLKRKIHYWATGNSVVRVESNFWYRVRTKLTGGQIITDIKDKYATLRIYGFYNAGIDKIIAKAEKECEKTCENCASKESVRFVGEKWVYCLCKKCRKK
jgi:hypothetical protein